ncbi:unnamed protein product [Dovyalis caffra]|uniref:Uncharacterized protein n=1 Tax=Dovyalis caffra TaxID=77055 RepID=A0AAV1QRM8_9ROSI|nr:unnamed protein product [Dovyalis caffra]
MIKKRRSSRGEKGGLEEGFRGPYRGKNVEQILSSLVMISEKVGLAKGSECQHSSINLHEDQDGSQNVLSHSLEVILLSSNCRTIVRQA